MSAHTAATVWSSSAVPADMTAIGCDNLTVYRQGYSGADHRPLRVTVGTASWQGCQTAAAAVAASHAPDPFGDASPYFHRTEAEAGGLTTACHWRRCQLAAVAAPTVSEVHCSGATEAVTGGPGHRDHCRLAAPGAATREGRHTCASRRPSRTAC